MPSSNGDDFQDISQKMGEDQTETEVELETGPRAQRPNFLSATRFVDFDLPPEILEGLDKAGFEYCTPIQAQAIPVAMKGLDIAGQAQTGTGKTTAFLVPLLNRLLNNKPVEAGVPRAIIVTPTRELALQIHEDAIILAGATGLRQALVIGGMEYKEQAELLAAGPEIVICTPGRIIDYLQQGVFKTKGIEVAVVDEADRLLDMGFIKDLKYLLSKLPPFSKRQTMLFSATLDERVLELTYQYMNPPQYITAEPDTDTKVSIAQELYHVGRDEKLSLLMGLLRREEHQRVIIFANTKSGVEWLSKKLTMNGFQAEGITGDLPQPKRLKLMEAFKENRLQILVATDVASRGIHVDNVSHVYNYDLPQDAENYVHRIGRTARAGHSGKAVSFGCEDYVFHLESIENLLGEKIPVFWAEADWFQGDQGGEVRLNDRKSDRRRSAGSPGKPGRGESGERRPISRGPAKSLRPGGIFGLSPRINGNGAEDTRQVLAWAMAEEAAVTPAEAMGVEATGEEAAGGALEAQANGERENGRRRKRRRGRRGKTVEAPEQARTAEPGPEDKAGATLKGKAEPALSEAGKKKDASFESRKGEAQPKAESAAAPHDGAPVAMEEPPKAAPAEPEAKLEQADAAPAKKPRRAPKKPAEAKPAEAKPADLNTPPAKTAKAAGPAARAEEPAPESGAKKPKRAQKKAAAPSTAESAPQPVAAAYEESQPKKKPRPVSKKKLTAEAGAGAAAVTKEAKAEPSKEPEGAGKAKKPARAKKSDVSAPSEAKKSRPVKKAEEPDEKPKKPAMKRAQKKTAGSSDGAAEATKAKASKKKEPKAEV